jgi:hypothetical protein
MPLPPITSGLVACYVGHQTADHAGTFRDLLGGPNATVTRASAATIYDPATGKIHDVGAGLIPLNPWSSTYAGGRGFAPVIEEARTNYLVNSYGAANDGSKWTTGWGLTNTTSSAPVASIVPGVYGSTAQRLVYTGSSDTNKNVLMTSSAIPKGSFAAGEAATISAWMKGSLSGCTVDLRTVVYDASDNLLTGGVSPTFTLTGSWQRFSYTHTSLPANASYVLLRIAILAIDTGDTIDITIDAVQLEKGAFATSYIPTTTAAAARAACVVTVPTTNWNAAAGTFMGVCGAPPSAATAVLVNWWKAASDLALLRAAAGVVGSYVRTNSTDYYATKAHTGTAFVAGGIYGDPTTAYFNGSAGTPVTPVTMPTGLPTTARIGSLNDTGQFYNAPIQCLPVYNRALTAAEVLANQSILNGLTRGSAAPMFMTGVL